MPARASRPYAFNRPLAQAKIDRERADDPIRKLYRTPTWRATRAAVIYRDQHCQKCGALICVNGSPIRGAVADHVINAHKYVAQHGNDPSYFFDESNLQGICQPCHDAKTAKECGFARSGPQDF